RSWATAMSSSRSLAMTARWSWVTPSSTSPAISAAAWQGARPRRAPRRSCSRPTRFRCRWSAGSWCWRICGGGWCGPPRRRGGGGKRGLGREVCDQAAAAGWDAGFIPEGELERFRAAQPLAAWGWRRPTLIVVDYAAARAHLLRPWLVELADHLAVPGKPLRL